MKLLAPLLLLCAVSGPAQMDAFLAGKRLLDVSRPTKEPLSKTLLLKAADITIPQVASGGSFALGGFITFFDLVNITDSTANVTVLFLDSNGNLVDLPFTAIHPDGTACIECPPVYVPGFQGTLRPGESRQQILQPAGPPIVAWAGILTDPAASVGVTATFMQIVPGRPLFMAGVPPSTPLQRRAWLSAADVAGFTTSIALVNSDPNAPRTFSLSYRSQFGGAVKCQTSFPIPAFGHRAFLLRDVLPCAMGDEGAVEIRSTGFFAGTGFWAHDSGGFVTQPLLERE